MEKSNQNGLSLQVVEKVAELARLKLTPQESSEILKQLSAVLSNFKELEAVSTQGVVPLVTPTDLQLVLREDEVEAQADRDKFIKNAPERSGQLFKVPPVV